MYYTVIKHFGHLRTLEKCDLSQCKAWLRLLYLLNKIMNILKAYLTCIKSLCRPRTSQLDMLQL